MTRLLTIETTCDETAAAVVEETGDPVRPWRMRFSRAVSASAAPDSLRQVAIGKLNGLGAATTQPPVW